MNFICIYCTHTFDCAERPPACPSCATQFTLTVTSDTSLFDLTMALDHNGRELDFTLRARLPEQHPEHMDVALAAAAAEHDWTVHESTGWTICRLCTVVQRADGQNKPCCGPVGLSLRGGERA